MTGRRLLWPLLPLFGLSLLVLGSLSWQLALNQGVFIILGLGLFIQKGWSTILSGLGSSNITHFVPLTMSLSYFIYHF